MFSIYNFRRSGDPQRGLRYLNRAHDAGCEDEDLFVIRCQCHLRLGNFALADKVEFIESIAYDLITFSLKKARMFEDIIFLN